MGSDLVRDELALLEDIARRRDRGLTALIDELRDGAISRDGRERLVRIVVDELCELPNGTDRRKLALEELLIHLGG